MSLSEQDREALVEFEPHADWCDYDDKSPEGCTPDFGCGVWGRRAKHEAAVESLIARHVTAALDDMTARVEGVLGTPPPPVWLHGNYDGRVGGTEHRTCGGRAWCFECSEWCYPNSYACPCCHEPPDPDDIRAALAHRPT